MGQIQSLFRSNRGSLPLTIRDFKQKLGKPTRIRRIGTEFKVYNWNTKYVYVSLSQNPSEREKIVMVREFHPNTQNEIQ